MPVMQSPPGPRVVIDGREMLYFAGTGYLGLQGDPRVIEAACEAARTYGVHPATSRTGFGESPPLLDVEERAARFFGTDRALYVVSGYAGMSTLVQSADSPPALILADNWLHLAGRDAAALSGARVERFAHGDPDDLRAQLARHGGHGPVFVLCDGVSPVRGDVAPINAFLSVLQAHGDARLLVDDAHGVGVLGRNGRGTLEHAADEAGEPIGVNIVSDGAQDGAGERQVWICGTLSKAIGGSGGIIPGHEAFIARLKATANWYHGAAATPAPAAGATAAALALCCDEPERRDALRQNAAYLRAGLRGLGLDVPEHPTPIICVEIGDGANMARLQAALLARGIAIAHSRNYAGVDDEGALRIAVFANHTPGMIDELVEAMRTHV
jgi:7-keto-8-aminopelargonate synthetase-like enzyme